MKPSIVPIASRLLELVCGQFGRYVGSYGAYVAYATIQASRDVAVGAFTNLGGGQDLRDAVARWRCRSRRSSQQTRSRTDPGIGNEDWREGPTMAEVRGPWWRNTWWGKRTAAMNLSIIVIVLLILLWKTLFM